MVGIIVSKNNQLSRLAMATAALFLSLFCLITLFPGQSLAADFSSTATNGSGSADGTDDVRTSVGPISGVDSGAGMVTIKGGKGANSGTGKGGDVNYTGVTSIESEMAIWIGGGTGGDVSAATGGDVMVAASGNVTAGDDILVDTGDAGSNGKSGDVSLTITGGNLVTATDLVIGSASAVHGGGDAGRITANVAGDINVGNDIMITGADNGAKSSADSGKITVTANSINASNGLSITAGSGGAANRGGSVEVTASAGAIHSNGGLQISGGAGATAAGGDVTVKASGGLTAANSIIIDTGDAGSNGKSGDVSLTITGGNLVTATDLVIGSASAVHGGGDAGRITANVAGDINVGNDIMITGANNGAISTDGGKITVTANRVNAGNMITITGGAGGPNGNGGGVAVNTGAIDSKGGLKISGGAAGANGNGGAATVKADNIISGGDINITAANGAALQQGGGATVEVKTLTLTGATSSNLHMIAGKMNGGGGGSAALTAETVNLQANSIWTLDREEKNGGDLKVDVANLNVEAGQTFTLTTTTHDSTDHFSTDRVHFQNMNLGRGATYSNLVFQDGATNVDRKEYYVGQLNIDHHATLSGGGVFAPGVSGTKITLNGIDADNLANHGGQAALTMGSNTYLDLRSATENTLKVNIKDDPQTVKALYEAIQGGDHILLIGKSDSTGGLTDSAGGYEITTQAASGMSNYVFKFGLNTSNEITSLGGAEGASILVDEIDGHSKYAPYSDASAAGLWAALQGQRALDKNIADLADHLAPGAEGTALALMGGQFRNETGSHVDMETYSVNLASGFKEDTWGGQVTYGYFVEAGHGDYDTYNQLQSLGNVKGDGQTNYLGGGFFLTTLWGGGAYLEVTGRGGAVNNDYKIEDRSGADFNTTNAYWGGHLGFGRRWDIIENGQLDLYGKALWTHQDTNHFLTGANEQVDLDSVDSIRGRLGGRYTHRWANGLQIYGGAAWEHEFNGQSKGQVDRKPIDKTAELEGSTGLIEVGLSLSPASGNFTIDVGLFGATGQEQGFGGTVGLKMAF
ncbi:MAG: hypothetical protein LBP55_02890 [Candidatus Adiutrix sp.]|jgi:hypothetical protein|nr:hypothetical protein [Candidatus Adiutrix sp.]